MEGGFQRELCSRTRLATVGWIKTSEILHTRY